MSDTELFLPAPGGSDRLRAPYRAAVVGAGIAGLAAATVLAERGASVVLIERESFLGGRAGAWTEKLLDGESFEMERGFHAFFRQYYNLRSLLRRIDPTLSLLRPVEDYPILGPAGARESFAGLPTTSPFNIIALTRRSASIGLSDLPSVNAMGALEMLTYDQQRTDDKFDDLSATEFLDSLGFPHRARQMLFSVFSHSFFNPERDMSAAELLMMFHFYFMGNREGLIFDVVDRPFSHALWGPLAARLRAQGVEIRLSTTCRRIERGEQSRWRIVADDDRVDDVDALILATTVPGLQSITGASPQLGDDSWRRQLAQLTLTRPFAVWRLWLDQPMRSGRHPFVGVTGLGCLDNISLYHELEGESRAWARRTGGSVVELHAYAVGETNTTRLKATMLRAFHQLYPEASGAKILEERFLLRQDCPGFPPGRRHYQPTVNTGFEGLCLAGDFVRLPFPSALMERAASSGILAANYLLAERGVRPEPLTTIPRRGLLARFCRRPAA